MLINHDMEQSVYLTSLLVETYVSRVIYSSYSAQIRPSIFTNLTFTAGDHHSVLYLDTTIFERSQRDYLQESVTIVYCGQRPQYS